MNTENRKTAVSLGQRRAGQLRGRGGGPGILNWPCCMPITVSGHWRELAAFRAQAPFFEAAGTLEVDLNFLGAIGGSSLTDLDQAVPTSDEEPSGIPSTYVPFRNSHLLGAAVAWAEVLGAKAVFIGANVLDNPGYPDSGRSILRPSIASSSWVPGPRPTFPFTPP